jgi:hypothetical protein
MPTPTGIWGFVNPVSSEEITAAKESLDKALLVQIGLPDYIDIRELDNGLFSLVNKVEAIFDQNFKPSRLISSLPELIADAEGLWAAVEPRLKGKIERKEFIGRVITYAYRKVDPNLPLVSGLAERIVESLILAAIPDLVDGLDDLAEQLIAKLKEVFN